MFGSIPTHLCMLSQVKIRNITTVQCTSRNSVYVHLGSVDRLILIYQNILNLCNLDWTLTLKSFIFLACVHQADLEVQLPLKYFSKAFHFRFSLLHSSFPIYHNILKNMHWKLLQLAGSLISVKDYLLLTAAKEIPAFLHMSLFETW